MTNKTSESKATPIAVTDRVTFVYQERTWTGTVVMKGRTRAHVVCDDQREVHIPYPWLTKLPEEFAKLCGARAFSRHFVTLPVIETIKFLGKIADHLE